MDASTKNKTVYMIGLIALSSIAVRYISVKFPQYAKYF